MEELRKQRRLIEEFELACDVSWGLISWGREGITWGKEGWTETVK